MSKVLKLLHNTSNKQASRFKNFAPLLFALLPLLPFLTAPNFLLSDSL